MKPSASSLTMKMSAEASGFGACPDLSRLFRDYFGDKGVPKQRMNLDPGCAGPSDPAPAACNRSNPCGAEVPGDLLSAISYFHRIETLAMASSRLCDFTKIMTFDCFQRRRSPRVDTAMGSESVL